MGEVIKTWLCTKLGLIVDTRQEVFGRYAQDGTLLAKLLHSYDVINDAQLDRIKPTQDPALCRVNLKHLRSWLRFVRIEFDDKSAEEVSKGKGSASLRLFYKIFLALESKDTMHFVTLQKERWNYISKSKKFDVVVVDEEIPPELPVEDPVAERLCTEGETIDWHREKFEKILDICKRERERFKEEEKKIEAEPNEPKEFPRSFRVKDNPEQENAESIEPWSGIQPSVDPKAIEDYRKWLKTRKLGNKLNAERFKSQRRILSNFWEKTLDKEEQEFDEIVASKVLSQSHFEKQLTTKLCEIRRYNIKVAENRSMIDKLVERHAEVHYRIDVNRDLELQLRASEEIELECRRMSELKLRIYEHKCCKLYQESYKFCLKILSEFVDISIRAVVFREENSSEVPEITWKEWKSLFLSNQPIFDLERDESSIKMEGSGDEIYRFELERQEALNTIDFENYHKLNEPWNYSLDIPVDEMESFKSGERVLGYIVHRLLDLLYPTEKEVDPTPIPKLKIMAVLLGIPNYIIPNFKMLLKHSRIHVIRLEDAINYCLMKYKEEMKDFKYIDENILNETSEIFEENLIKEEKKSRKRSQSSKSHYKGSVQKQEQTDKTTQTPRKIPYEDVDPILSNEASTGKIAYEFLTLGEPISDDLNSKLLLEYIKSLDDVEGWVILNYPTNYYQMTSLESALSGVQKIGGMDLELDPVQNINDLEATESRITFENEPMENKEVLKQSKLFPNPLLKNGNGRKRTLLTMFSRIVEKPKNLGLEDLDLTIALPKDATDLDEFYATEGIGYVFYYSTFDTNTLKRLGRALLEDESMPRRPSVELFGDSPGFLENQDDEKSDFLVKTITENYEDAEDLLSGSETNLEAAVPKPGDEKWQWCDFQLDPDVVQTMGKLWETLELAYIGNLKDIFFLKRLHSTSIIPYKSFVSKHMTQFINRPDGKQTRLREFQAKYNEVPGYMRADIEIKCELHCRVADFQTELWNLCDERKKECEDERRRLIANHWTTLQCIILSNIFINILEIEFDRFVDTLQIICDYYTASLQKPLPKYRILRKVPLNRIDFQFLLSESQKSEFRPEQEILKVQEKSSFYKSRSKESLQAAPPGDEKLFEREIPKLLISSTERFQAKENVCYKEVYRNIEFLESLVENISSTIFETLRKEYVAVTSRNASTASDLNLKRRNSLLEEWKVALLFEINRIRLRLKVLGIALEHDVQSLLETMMQTFHQMYYDIAERYNREMSSVNEMAAVLKRAIEEEVPIPQEMILEGDRFFIRSSVLLFPEEHTPPPSPFVEEKYPTEFMMVQLGRLVDIFKYVARNGWITERAFVYILQDLIALGEEQGEVVLLPSSWFQLSPPDIENLVSRLLGVAERIDWREFVIYAMDMKPPSQEEILDARRKFRSFDARLKEVVNEEQFLGTPLWFCEHCEVPYETKFVLHENFETSGEGLYDEQLGLNENEKIAEVRLDPVEKNIGRNGVPILNSWGETKSEATLRFILAKQLLCQMFLADCENVRYVEFLRAFCKDEDPKQGFAKALSLALGAKVCVDFNEGEEYVARVLEGRRGNFMVDADRDFQMSSKLVSEVFETDLKNNSSLARPSEISMGSTEEKIEGNNGIASMIFHESHLSGIEDRVIHWIPRDVCQSVLSVALPNYIKNRDFFETTQTLREKIDIIYLDLKGDELSDDETTVLSHRLIHHPFIAELLEGTNKFTHKYLGTIFRQVLEESLYKKKGTNNWN